MSSENQEKLHELPGQDCPRSGGAERWEKPHMTTFEVDGSGNIVGEFCESCKMRLYGPDPESLPRAAQILEVEDGRD